MADITLYQLSQAADANGAGVALYPGFYLLWLKDALVANGATVLGSGDGISRFGHVDAATTVPGGEQGSGGQYDCWSVGATTDGVAGNAGNIDAWCHLELPSGKQVFLGGPTFAIGYYGIVGHAIDGAAFDGTLAAAATPPTAPSGVIWSTGTSPTSSGALIPSTTALSDVHYFDLIILEGGDEWIVHAYFLDDSAGVYEDDVNAPWQGVVGIENPHPDDTDPWYYLRGNPSNTGFGAWNYADSLAANNLGPTSNFISMVDNRVSPDTTLCYPYSADCNNTTDVEKGVANRDMIMAGDALQSWGYRLTEVNSSRVYIQPRPTVTARIFMRWPDASTPQVGAVHSDVNAWDPVPRASSVADTVNRVWDTVEGGFVRWATVGADTGGASYPGPGTFGVNTSDYCVETFRA